jgi:hypothetical protein
MLLSVQHFFDFSSDFFRLSRRRRSRLNIRIVPSMKARKLETAVPFAAKLLRFGAMSLCY